MKASWSEGSLADAIVLAGSILLENGAETRRIEDTMFRLAHAYGAEEIETYATPGMLMVSFSYHGKSVWRMRRTRVRSTDLEKIDQINSLSRLVSANALPLTQLVQELKRVQEGAGVENKQFILGAATSSFGFALLFHASFYQACMAGILGGTCGLFLQRSKAKGVFKNLMASAFISFFASFAHSKLILLGALMILVPGMLLTNALRDIVNGDPISGMSRLGEAITIAASIALGNLAIQMLGCF